jgi:RHS repeat-associated protein
MNRQTKVTKTLFGPNPVLPLIPVNFVTTETKYYKNGLVEWVKDANGHTTSYNYDGLGRILIQKIADGTPDVSTTTYDYDLQTHDTVTLMTDAVGRQTNYTYDNINRVLSSTASFAPTIQYIYDSTRPKTTTTTFDGTGVQSTVDEYDRFFRLTKSTNPINTIIENKYFDDGAIKETTIRSTHYPGAVATQTTAYGYDPLGRQNRITDALGHSTNMKYDLVGNLIETTDANTHVTSYEYDSLNRKIKSSTNVTLDGVITPVSTTYKYDKNSNLISVTDALNHITNYVYDELNRQVKVIDAKNNATTNAYDAVGNILSITDANNNTTSYTYDALDRQITDTNQFGKKRTYSYDTVGDLIQTIDRNGHKRTYDYDASNRQTAEHWLDAAGNDLHTFTYGYDAVGHLLSSKDPDSKYTYTYDAVDRLNSVDNTGTPGTPAVKFAYNYDAAGNLLSVTDAINGTLAGTNAYTYDILNRVTRITQLGTGVTSKRVDMSYDALNRLTEINRYGDLTGTISVADSIYSYDAAGRLTNITHKYGASKKGLPPATAIASYGFSYDATNRITQSSGIDGTHDYSYDDTNQLTAANHTTQANEAYSYDANGNRTSVGYGTGTDNRLLTDGTYNYTYDDEGNRTKRVEIATGKVTEYNWDYRNRLTSVKFKDAGGNVTKTIEYIYDVNNQRIGKKINGVVAERYVIDRNQIALVFDGNGDRAHRYLYGTGVDQVLADETPTSMVWALADNQGTVKDLVDNSGAVLNHITYDSYGRVIAVTNPAVEFRYGYTGREQDNETALDYYRARYYDPSVGRFISQDPIGFSAGDSNLYRYVLNSPVNATDPSGLEPVKDQAKTVKYFIESLADLPETKKIGTAKGAEAERELIRLGEVQWNFLPANPDLNGSLGRYIYTAKGGWIDMSHFMFYAGRAYQAWSSKNKIYHGDLHKYHVIKGTMDDGYTQEFMDQFARNGVSAYSYEDLPSDYFGIDFAVNYFNPNSELTLGQQVGNYLNNKLGALEPEQAPNWNLIPRTVTRDQPKWINKTTVPMFTR